MSRQVSAQAFGTADASFAGEAFERGSCGFMEWMRLKEAVSPLLQPLDQGDPSSIRIASRSVRAALRERYLSENADRSTYNLGGAAGVHRRIAMHLIDEAAGVWNDELGVVFRTYEQLDEQPLTLETLPRHLSKVLPRSVYWSIGLLVYWFMVLRYIVHGPVLRLSPQGASKDCFLFAVWAYHSALACCF